MQQPSSCSTFKSCSSNSNTQLKVQFQATKRTVLLPMGSTLPSHGFAFEHLEAKPCLSYAGIMDAPPPPILPDPQGKTMLLTDSKALSAMCSCSQHCESSNAAVPFV